MSSLYNVNSACLRYIVPFKYDGIFKDVVAKVEGLHSDKPNKKGEYQKLWERRKCTLEGPESDLYGYVRNEFKFDDDTEPLAEQKTGCEWLFWNSAESEKKNGKKIKEFLYFPEALEKTNKELPIAWNVSIINLGLVVFRNGLGFIWYEIEVPEKGVTSNDLMHFQNVIRELSRSENAVLWEKKKTNEKPAYGVVLEERPDGYNTYMMPFSLGYWVNNVLSFFDVTYLAERKNSFVNMVENSLKSAGGLPNEKISLVDADASDTHNLPDKAILFTYASFESREAKKGLDSQYSLVYHITNGYKESYHLSREVASEIKMPFDNTFWYATQEGAAYLTWVDFDNKAVFDNLILSKAKIDYFALYLKALYQSFSLLIYADKIQTEISAVNGKYLIEPLDKRITELFAEINLFLTKSMATSVSHIHHQSEFYLYLKKQLRIHDDVESVTAGLNALDILQREQRQREENQRAQEELLAEQKKEREEQKEREEREEREKIRDGKLQTIMGLFTLLGIASALVDGFDLVSKFDLRNGEFWKLVSAAQIAVIVLFVVIGIVSVLAIVASVVLICDAHRKKK